MKYAARLCLLMSLTSVSAAEPGLGTREVWLSNESVEVIRLTYPVGTESGMHGHAFPYRAIYVVKGGKLELVPADEREEVRMVEVQDGEALFMPAAKHNVRNVGDTEIILVETEIK